MRISFFAATPFQVFNCINIYKNQYPQAKADIFILTFAVDMRQLVEKLRRTNMFCNVYVLDKINAIPGKWGVIKDFLFTDSTNYQMLTDNTYDLMYTTYIGDRNNLYYNILLKKNKHITPFFYDEGIGIYTTGYYKSSKLMQMFYRFLRLRYINQYFSEVHVYAPECVCIDIDVPIKEIPSVDKQDKVLVNCYNEIFEGNKDSSWKYDAVKCIYLDQDFSRYLTDEQYRTEFKFSHHDILNVLIAKIKKDEIIVKKHPIRQDRCYEEAGYNVEQKSSLPWEIVQLNGDFSDKILVGINSTALLTPKMIYDEEPYVIILGKMLYNEGLSDKVWTNNIEELFTRVQSMYRNKKKFIIPETMQQYNAVVQSLEVNEGVM